MPHGEYANMSKPTIEMQSLVDAQDNPAIVIDENYRIIAANKIYCDSYGISPQDILNHRCHEVSHRSPRPCHENGEDCPHRKVFATHQSTQVLHTHYDREGRPDYVKIRAHPLRDGEGHEYLLEGIHRLAPAAGQSCDGASMIGCSKAFVACVEGLTTAANTDAPVLITGESGVGKELAAQFIHNRSRRCAGANININCAAIPESLCESEFFGHEKGAFTGCTTARKGLFELADGGTLFLDEIGELPLPIQAKVLRVLDSGEFWRVGGRSPQRADVRIIAATNRDLRRMVVDGRFREDLYYRIAAMTVHVPALRDRQADIPLLADFLAKRYGSSFGRPVRFTKEARERLAQYSFPGNIRELCNIVQRAVAMANDGLIDVEHLGLDNARERVAACVGHNHAENPTIRAIERDYMTRLMQEHNGNKRLVAGILGISERTLYRRLKEYGEESNAA
jgi:transcriptional regulator with PAS, ATPase and Fis domain